MLEMEIQFESEDKILNEDYKKKVSKWLTITMRKKEKHKDHYAKSIDIDRTTYSLCT